MSKPEHSIETLRNAWQAATDRHAGGRDCPSDETLFDVAQGRLDAEERQRIIAHTAVCGACAQSWRAAVELQRARPDISDATDRKRPAHRQPASWMLAAAAALAAALGIVWMLPHIDPGVLDPGTPSVLRGDEQSGFTLDGPDSIRLPAERISLSWQAVEGAAQYHIRVSDATLNTLHAGSASASRFDFPADALRQIADGERLYWFVIAELEDGTRLRSETGTMIVKREPGTG
ncbi:MAG: hypothetical protein WD397_13120 [Wenzhouxiangellaceae bacterium]